MKQIQFGTFAISDNAEYNQAVRAQVEGSLNKGWWLDSWQVIEKGVDVNNLPVVFIAVCLQREVDDEDAAPVEEDA